LFNLDKLEKRPDDIVVLCDSPEIPELNPSLSGNPGIILTSWLCDEGCYDQIDWSPLKGRPHVCCLVTNHSARSLDDAYVEAKRLSNYLVDNKKLDCDLRFVQVYVEQSAEALRYERLADLVRHRSRTPPQVIEDSIIPLGLKEFEECLAKAEGRRRNPFHRPSDMSQVVTVDRANGIGQILLRPAIRQGSVTIFHARQKVGKSSFALSLCASIVAQDAFLEDRFWTVPTAVRGKVGVVFFDFECDSARIDKTHQQFVLPYFSDDASQRADQERRFHRVSLIGAGALLADEAGHQRILAEIEKCRQAIGGNPPLLVVFDPLLSGFGYREDMSSWPKAKLLFDKIRLAGAAILVVHHSTKGGDASGFLNKLRDAGCEMTLVREGQSGASTLSSPSELRILEGSWIEMGEDKAPIPVIYEHSVKRWRVDHKAGDGRHDWGADEANPGRLDCFYELVREYHDHGYKDEAIYVELGMSRANYFKLKAKVKAVKGEGWETAPSPES
jgi:hypothetical protein